MTEGTEHCLRDRAPMLSAFGMLDRRVAKLVIARPELAKRLALAPRSAIHSIGIFLHLCPEASGEAAEVAALIDTTHPRDLLRMALPDAPAQLYRALDRVGDRVRGRAFYRRLGAIASGQFGSAFLAGRLSDQRLDFYEMVATMDPAVVAVCDALEESQRLAESVDVLVKFLRSHKAITDADLCLVPGAGINALLRRLQRSFDAIRAPDPGFHPPVGWRIIETIRELRSVGREFENCLNSRAPYAVKHWLRLVDGTGVYIINEKERVLVALRRVAGNLYCVDEAAKSDNEDVAPHVVRALFWDDFRAAGIQILPTSPDQAIAQLDHAAGGMHETDDAVADLELAIESM